MLGTNMQRRKRRRVIISTAAWSAAAVLSVWALGAIVFDGPLRSGSANGILAGIWAVASVVMLLLSRGNRRRLAVWAGCFLVVFVPWLTIRPSNDRDWQIEWARTCWADVNGDVVTFHDFRNFDYTPTGEVVPRWEDRSVRLSNLRGLSVFLDKFGGELIAHPIVSFDFGPDGFVALSVETRREKGEAYSEFGGLYKRFELQYVFGDERDFIRVRTNVRDEPVYLYRVKISEDRVRERFDDSVKLLNELHERPRFYNVLTANCTTSLRAQTPEHRRRPFDYRMIANGRLDELAYEWGSLETDGLSFEALLEQALVNESAKAAHNASDFSRRIREGRVGFDGTEGAE